MAEEQKEIMDWFEQIVAAKKDFIETNELFREEDIRACEQDWILLNNKAWYEVTKIVEPTIEAELFISGSTPYIKKTFKYKGIEIKNVKELKEVE